MSLADWIRESKDRFREYPFGIAVRVSVGEFVTGVLRRVGKVVNYGDSIWERDWDVLVILDACRYDLAVEVSPEYGHTVSPVWSEASMSLEFYEKTFGETHTDEQSRTALITANPFSQHENVELANLGYVDEVWRDVWSDEHGITLPEDVFDVAIAYWREKPDSIDRMIVWAMQPHVPFINNELGAGFNHNYVTNWGTGKETEQLSPWRQAAVGEVSTDDLWAAYQDNLRYAFDAVETLRTSITADIAITSDHGNAMGEWGVWEHPPYVPLPSIKRVPWIELIGRDTGEYTPTLERTDTQPDGDVERKLRDLGYL